MDTTKDRLTKDQLSARIDDIFRMREDGRTFQEIANKHGVSKQRIYELWRKHKPAEMSAPENDEVGS